jgi:hypothetical protein
MFNRQIERASRGATLSPREKGPKVEWEQEEVGEAMEWTEAMDRRLVELVEDRGPLFEEAAIEIQAMVSGGLEDDKKKALGKSTSPKEPNAESCRVRWLMLTQWGQSKTVTSRLGDVLTSAASHYPSGHDFYALAMERAACSSTSRPISLPSMWDDEII